MRSKGNLLGLNLGQNPFAGLHTLGLEAQVELLLADLQTERAGLGGPTIRRIHQAQLLHRVQHRIAGLAIQRRQLLPVAVDLVANCTGML